jgi:hypothetical protein
MQRSGKKPVRAPHHCLRVAYLARPVGSVATDSGLPPGARTVSIFLVNRRAPAPDEKKFHQLGGRTVLQKDPGCSAFERPQRPGVAHPGGDPRRSARMTHFCSLRLTHTKNTFCLRARNGASDIIHAAGVRVDFPSSAPKARNALTLHGESACAGEGIDPQGRQGQPAQHLPHGKKALLPGDKTPPNWPWWWVTFGEQSRVISRECRRMASQALRI